MSSTDDNNPPPVPTGVVLTAASLGVPTSTETVNSGRGGRGHAGGSARGGRGKGGGGKGGGSTAVASSDSIRRQALASSIRSIVPPSGARGSSSTEAATRLRTPCDEDEEEDDFPIDEVEDVVPGVGRSAATATTASCVSDGGAWQMGEDDGNQSVTGSVRGDSGEGVSRRHRKRVRSNACNAQLSMNMFSTLFGSAPGSGPLMAKRARLAHSAEESGEESEEEGGEESADDAMSTVSNGSQARRQAEQSLFHIPGVHCVGCILPPARLEAVDSFVLDNAANKQGDILWRSAAHVYEETVVRPCRREQSSAPDWQWTELREHYEQHVVHPKLFRVQACREMREIRAVLTEQMIIQNDETGTRELDKASVEQYLKVETAESKEYALLANIDAANTRTAAASVGKGGSALVPSTSAVPSSGGAGAGGSGGGVGP